MFWLILLVVVVAGFVVWKFRVKILAKVLGQSESRVDRQLNRRKYAAPVTGAGPGLSRRLPWP